MVTDDWAEAAPAAARAAIAISVFFIKYIPKIKNASNMQAFSNGVSCFIKTSYIVVADYNKNKKASNK